MYCKIIKKNTVAIDKNRFYWLQSDRINATRPRIGGIRKWEMTSAGRIGVSKGNLNRRANERRMTASERYSKWRGCSGTIPIQRFKLIAIAVT